MLSKWDWIKRSSTVNSVTDDAAPEHENERWDADQKLGQADCFRGLRQDANQNPGHQQLLYAKASHPQCVAGVVPGHLEISMG